jgi:DNA (cytosine-5)-methyltransferase 1
MGIEKNLIVDMKPISDPMKNDEGIRKMTPREWARLQGFPDSFVFPVSMTRSYKQIANSVSVPVIKLIAIQMGIAIMNYYGPDYD